MMVPYGRPRRSPSLISSISTLLFLFCWTPRLAAQALEPVTEESVKAAYLYRFAEYVRWPAETFESPTTPFTIAVVGNRVLAEELRMATADRSAYGRPVAVQEHVVGDSLQSVHMLFVAAASMEDVPRLREAARQRSVVLVTESPDALRLGSVINFTPVDRRVRFEVSLQAAEASNVRLSSQLLAVAERVEPVVH